MLIKIARVGSLVMLSVPLMAGRLEAQPLASEMPVKIEIEEALNKIPASDGKRYVQMLRHGTMSLLLYAPKGTDDQQPHARDELYVVMKGHGIFVRDSTRTEFKIGDVLFVGAGVSHRFENFTDDLALWVVFYGQPGGEDR